MDFVSLQASFIFVILCILFVIWQRYIALLNVNVVHTAHACGLCVCVYESCVRFRIHICVCVRSPIQIEIECFVLKT